MSYLIKGNPQVWEKRNLFVNIGFLFMHDDHKSWISFLGLMISPKYNMHPMIKITLCVIFKSKGSKVWGLGKILIYLNNLNFKVEVARSRTLLEWKTVKCSSEKKGRKFFLTCISTAKDKIKVYGRCGFGLWWTSALVLLC